MNKIIAFLIVTVITTIIPAQDINSWYLPINNSNRQSISDVQLTKIGDFGLLRKARPKVREHFHTGIDIKRPTDNYYDEPIYAATEGVVISLRDDGPFAQIIIEHKLSDSTKIWTVYEHIAGIQVRLNDLVSPYTPIARFMTKDELNKYGWQFDHVHFEVMKKRPVKVEPDFEKPDRLYATYCLTCYSADELYDRYYHPMDFLYEKFNM